MKNYEEFKQDIIAKTRQNLPADFAQSTITVETFWKNNDVRLEGLVIRQKENYAVPTIYLKEFYQQYQDGKAFETIAQEIAAIRVMSSVYSDKLKEQPLTSFQAVKDKLQIKVQNLESNQEYLKNKPFKKFQDLAVTYHIVVGVCDEGRGSVTITNEMLAGYGISVDELHEQAMANSMQKSPPNIRPMNQILGQLNGMAEKTETDGGWELKLAALPLDDMMYILTNQDTLNGAAVMVYPDLLAEIADQFQNNLVILPSSIHECLILPQVDHPDYKELADMVREINETQVEPLEVLSNHVYHYDRAERKLSIADTNKRQQSISEKLKKNKAVEVAPAKQQSGIKKDNQDICL